MPNYDVRQDKMTNRLKVWSRKELGKDCHDGKLQMVTVVTNTVTGKISIESCNVVLEQDVKKLLREALGIIERQQTLVATLQALSNTFNLKRKGKKK